MKNKIEQFASVERDFPGLLIQAQQYLLFRVDMSDMAPAEPTKGQPTLSTLPAEKACPGPHCWCVFVGVLGIKEYLFVFISERPPPSTLKSTGKASWPALACVSTGVWLAISFPGCSGQGGSWCAPCCQAPVSHGTCGPRGPTWVPGAVFCPSLPCRCHLFSLLYF